ncbi:C40 family peptidase, partial [Mycolicibacterium insubricum]|nr:C40 family peptidase [Mycolicibacterium insubricum]
LRVHRRGSRSGGRGVARSEQDHRHHHGPAPMSEAGETVLAHGWGGSTRSADSPLTQYSFAGVGVLIPKYSGDQYNTGRKVPISQAKRGDLIFWPGGSQHVALYLGNGQMLEASGSAARVKVSPVRTSGIQPYAAR